MTDPIQAPAQPAHTSHSQFEALNTCGKRFQLSRVLGLEGTPWVAAAGGSAVHAATEAYDLEHFRTYGH